MILLRLAWADLSADRARSLLQVAAVAPIVAAFLILVSIAAGLRVDDLPPADQRLVVLSPNALDPASGRLEPEILDLIEAAGGDAVAAATPMIFRPMRVGDRVLQLRAAPFETWETVHGLTLLAGSWPADGDEVAITEGIAIATGWTVGSGVEIFGTEFAITGLVRAAGTKFASVWMRFDRADDLFEGRSGFQMVTVVPAAGADIGDLGTRLEEAMAGRYSVYLETDLAAQTGAREDAADALAAVSTLIGIAALAFGGFNLSAITLSERRQDVGIARSIGFGTPALVSLAVVRSALLATGGFAAGSSLAAIVLATAEPTTVRSFVFTPELGPASWLLGLAITVLATVAGTGAAIRAAANTPIHDLVSPS